MRSVPDDQVPGVRKRRVPLANFRAPLRGAGTPCQFLHIFFQLSLQTSTAPPAEPLEVAVQLNRDHVIVSALRPRHGVFKRFSDQDMFDVWLKEHDSYYYSQEGTRPLPVLRVRFNEQTWLYLNPQHGQMTRYDRMSRVNRWLYKGLHDLDLPFLVYRRPMWDITVIVLSMGGILLSLTTLLPAFRRLRRHARKLLVRRMGSVS